MRPLVVISKENEASLNIKERLLSLEMFDEKENGFWRGPDFDMEEYPGKIIEIVPSRDAECYIFASTHRSASNIPVLSAHTPGNWGNADMGGKPRTLNTASAHRLKAALCKLKELSGSLGWQVCLEVDHHGPTLERPVLFVEIGSTENEWKNPEAGGIAAQAVLSSVRAKKDAPAFVGFGGAHYTAKFTPIALGSEKALGHIISGYSLEQYGADEEMVRQAFLKNDSPIAGALIDWKGIKGETRRKLIETLDGMGMKWEKA